jgi:hypothetical protein
MWEFKSYFLVSFNKTSNPTPYQRFYLSSVSTAANKIKSAP